MKRRIWFCLQACIVLLSIIAFSSQSRGENRALSQVIEPDEAIDAPTLPNIPNIPPIMTDESEDGVRHLDLATFLVDVRVTGVLARTTMTMTFYNPGPRPVAGNLYVPLPLDASISGYALDVNGVMVDGVPVERNTARQVYETIVARGIDPGLVEWTRGNVFKTRVFPVPSKGSRTVRLSYMSTIQLAKGSAKPRLVIPFDFKKPIADFKLSLEVVKPSAKPLVSSSSWTSMQFLNWRDGFRSDFSAKNFTPDSDCVIELPLVDDRAVVLEKNYHQDFNGAKGAWFLWTKPNADSSQAATTQTNVNRAQVIPAKELTLYWDASLSRIGARHDLIIKTLTLWLAERAKIQANAVDKVHLVVYRESAEPTRSYTVNKGQAADLFRDLAALSYDGGTRSGFLPAPIAKSQMVILVSDGFYTIGQKAFPDMAQPVFSLASEARLDASSLQGIASANGGDFILVEDPEQAAKRLGRASYRLISAVANQGKVSLIEALVDSKKELTGVTGLLETQSAKLSLSYGYGNIVTEKIDLELNLGDAVDAAAMASAQQFSQGNLGLFWAQNKLLRLMASPDAQLASNKAEMRDLGLQWNLVSPGTSLLVLESLAQYLEFKIAPPVSLASMRAEYFKSVEEQKAQKQLAGKAHQDKVFEWWQERLTWYNTKFDYPADYRAPQLDKKSAESEMMADGEANEDARALRSEMPNASPRIESTGAIAQDQALAGQEKAKDSVSDAASVSIQAWQPDTPYIRSLIRLVGQEKPSPLSAAMAQKAYNHYLELRTSYLKSPSFFFDVGDFFQARGASSYAIRIWSVLTEMDLEAPGLLRIVAYRLTQTGRHELAQEIFEQVLTMRPEEPQSWRDLALVLDTQKEHAKAVDLLWHVASNAWTMTPQVELIALMEMNAAIARAKTAGQKYSAAIPARFIKTLDSDVRIVLTWDTNLSDMDLWVIEPSGEKAYYGNQRTHIGGLVSQDITTGYGPEEYLLKKAMRGTYKIMVNYFGNQNPELNGTVTLQAEIITNFARPNEKRQALTLSLQGEDDEYTVGSIVW